MITSIKESVLGAWLNKALLADAVKTRITRTSSRPVHERNHTSGPVVIIGGGLSNRGAQAMTFTVVSEFRHRFPEKDIYLLSSSDFKRSADERSQYQFEILPWNLFLQLAHLPGGGPIRERIEFDQQIIKTIDDVLDAAAVAIDISGYGLTSQFRRRQSQKYLANLAIAQRYDIPYYIFPQSVGPFEFTWPHHRMMKFLLRTYLQYPDRIYPREEAGADRVHEYRTDGVQRAMDIVLTHEYDLEHVFKEPPEQCTPKLPDGTVGIAPNVKVFQRMSNDEFDQLYKQILSTITDISLSIAIIQHSEEDEYLCDRIASLTDEDVTVITGDYYAFELEETIAQLDFLIGSRYHSLIHSYKRDTPAIAIGWAEKYRELLAEFDDAERVFDVRESLSTDDIVEAIHVMTADNGGEKIKAKRQEIVSNAKLFVDFDQPE